MAKKAQDLTISTVPAKKVVNDLAGEEEKRRQRLEAQREAQEQDRQERERIDQEIADRTRAKQAAPSREKAARNLEWKRGFQGERRTDEGYLYSRGENDPKPSYENVGKVTSERPATKEDLREAEKISIREHFYSQEDAPEKGSARERWFSFTPEERALAKKMAFDGYDENDAQMREFAERMGGGYAPEGVGVIGEAYQSELDSTAGKAELALESEYERQDNAERDAQTKEEDMKALSGFSRGELEILFEAIGRKTNYNFYLPKTYEDLGAKSWEEKRDLRNSLVEKAGGLERVAELYETFTWSMNEANSKMWSEAGKNISEWNGTAGFVFARAGDFVSALGSIPEAIYNLVPALNGSTGRYSTADPNAGLAAWRAGAASADEGTKHQILDALAEQFPDNQFIQLAAGYGYDALGQAANNLLRNFALGPLGLAMMGTDSFNRSYNEAAAMGISPGKAAAASTIKALGEVGTELIPFDSARKSLAGKSTIKSLAVGFFGEVIGEELSELIGDAAEDIIYVDDSGYNVEIEKRVLGGQDYEEAKAEVDAQYQRKYLDIMIETILSSGASEGAQYAAGKMMNAGENQQQSQEQTVQQNPVDAIVDGTVQDIVSPEQQVQAAEPAAPVMDAALEQAVQEVTGVQQKFGSELENPTMESPEDQNYNGRNTASVSGAVNGSETVTTVTGEGGKTRDIPVRYAIMPISEITASHDAYGNENPDYPQEMQPRDRSRAAGQQQTARMGKNLNPALLTDSKTAQNGSPIVTPDGFVIGGNGRTIGIASAMQNGNGQAYHDYLVAHAAEFGIDPNSIPMDGVLVRVTDEKDTAALARELNVSTTSASSATETSNQDAGKIGEIIGMLSGDSDITDAGNRDFVAAFLSKVIPAEERGNVIDEDGNLNLSGLTRIQNAIFTYAYGDAGLAKRVTESLNNDIKNATNALLQVAPKVAQLKSNIESGNVRDIGLSKAITDGVNLFLEAKKSGSAVQDIANQTTMDGSGIRGDTISTFLAEALEKNTRSGKNIRTIVETLISNNQNEEIHEEESLFGEEKPKTQEDIVNETIEQLRKSGVDGSKIPEITDFSQFRKSGGDVQSGDAVRTERKRSAETGISGNGSENVSGKGLGGVNSNNFDGSVDNSVNAVNTDNGTSVGAASAGFTNDADYNALGQKYGVQKARANDAVPTNVPKNDKDGRKVSQVASNIYGSAIIKDSTLGTLRELIKNGEMSYDVQSNDKTYAKALEKLKGKTWGQAIENLRRLAVSGGTSADAVMQADILMEYFMQMQNEDGEIGTEARRQLAEIASVSKMLSVNSGRTLQTFKSFRKLHPAVASMMFQNDMVNTFQRLANGQGYKAKSGGAIALSEHITQEYTNAFNELQKAKTDDARNAAREKLADIQNAAALEMAAQMKAGPATKLRAWRYMSMLGNFKTQGRNIVGNAGMIPLRDVSRAMQGVMQKALIRDESRRTVSNLGFSEADNDLRKWAKEDSKSRDIQDAFAYTGKLGEDATSQKYADMLRVFDNPALEWVRKTTNSAIKNGDMMFKNREYIRAMASWMKAQGITAEQVRNGEISTEKLNEGRSHAIEQALIATFNDSNRFSDVISRMKIQDTQNNVFAKAVNAFGEGIMPFRKTPANVAVRAVENSPLGLINGMGHLAADMISGNGTSAQTIAKVCDGMTGTALYAAGMLLANGFCGIKLHGASVDEEDKKDGVQPWSVELPGGYIYDVSWLAPANMPLFMGVETVKALSGDGIDFGSDGVWGVIDAGGRMLEPILNLSCMSSISDFLDTMAYANGTDKIWTAVTQGASSYLGQFIPSLVRQIYTGAKEYKQTTYTNTGNTLERQALQLVGGIPGVGDLAGLKTDKLDEYGQPVKTNQAGSNSLLAREINALFGLGKMTRRENDPLRAEEKRLREAGAGKVNIALPEKKGAAIDEKGNWIGEKRYTKSEWEQIARSQGEENQKIREFIESAEYQAMSDDEKVKAIKKLQDQAKDTALQSMLWDTIQNLDAYPQIKAKAELRRKDGDFEKMAEAMKQGLSFQQFRKIVEGYQNRDGNKAGDKLLGVTGANTTEKAVEAMLPSYMNDSQNEKWGVAQKYGVSAGDFAKAYDAYNKDGTGLVLASEEKLVKYFGKVSYGKDKKGKPLYFKAAGARKMINLMNAGFTQDQALAYWLILEGRAE